NVEIIRARGGEKCLRASHGVLYVDVVAKQFRSLDTLTNGVAPGRFSRRALEHDVDRVTGDTERRCRTLRYEHERECVKRPRPLDQPWVLEAESAPFLDELVPHDDVVAA